MADGSNWCIIPGETLAERGIIYLHEPAWSDRHVLIEHLRKGEYRKPFVIENGEIRRLHFGLEYVQSEMSLSDPYALNFSYTRKMMAFLLFLPKPRKIVIVGLGGGSLTKFCHRQLPRSKVVTVEINREVIDMGKLFDLPKPDARLQLLHADARDYFAESDGLLDVILLDGCDRYGTAPELCSDAFYRQIRTRLHSHGVAVVNMTGTPSGISKHLALLEQVFEERVIVIDVRDCHNRLAFVFNSREALPDWEAVARRANELTLQYALDFCEFARLLRRSFSKKKLRSKW